MKAKILWVEGRRNRKNIPSYILTLQKKEFEVEIAANKNDALLRIYESKPDLVVINAPTLRTSGKKMCNEIRDKVSELPILLITDPQQPISGKNAADLILELPFTSRKLVNRIVSLIHGDGKILLHIGWIRLDLERKRVRCKDRESNLTPRSTKLLKVLMDHAGEVVKRENLFSEVWDTKYTGDTRSLDVHVSWLREAIEENPRQPQFLKTIRGVGYRLDT
jgi:DNA-binding response OmpR family regulator